MSIVIFYPLSRFPGPNWTHFNFFGGLPPGLLQDPGLLDFRVPAALLSAPAAAAGPSLRLSSLLPRLFADNPSLLAHDFCDPLDTPTRRPLPSNDHNPVLPNHPAATINSGQQQSSESGELKNLSDRKNKIYNLFAEILFRHDGIKDRRLSHGHYPVSPLSLAQTYPQRERDRISGLFSCKEPPGSHNSNKGC